MLPSFHDRSPPKPMSLPLDQQPSPTDQNGCPPYAYDSLDSDSDSSGKDSPISTPPDHHLLYPYGPAMNADPQFEPSKENKSLRRQYFDYGITAPKYGDSETTIETAPDQSLLSSHSFPWELPSPTTARIHRAHDKDFRTESPSFFHSQPFWLVLYFCFNLGLTLYNKAVLIHFPYAYALTALHALCGSIGGFALFRLGVYVPAKLTKADNLALVAFSLLYTINIAVSNLSLELVTIPVSPVNGCPRFSF